MKFKKYVKELLKIIEEIKKVSPQSVNIIKNGDTTNIEIFIDKSKERYEAKIVFDKDKLKVCDILIDKHKGEAFNILNPTENEMRKLPIWEHYTNIGHLPLIIERLKEILASVKK